MGGDLGSRSSIFCPDSGGVFPDGADEDRKSEVAKTMWTASVSLCVLALSFGVQLVVWD